MPYIIPYHILIIIPSIIGSAAQLPLRHLWRWIQKATDPRELWLRRRLSGAPAAWETCAKLRSNLPKTGFLTVCFFKNIEIE